MEQQDLLKNEYALHCQLIKQDDRDPNRLSCPFRIDDELLCQLYNFLEYPDDSKYNDVRMFTALIAKGVVRAHEGELLTSLSCLQSSLIFLESLKGDINKAISDIADRIEKQSNLRRK